MKKLLATVMMVVVLTLSLGMAQAEVTMTGHSVLYSVNGFTGEQTAEKFMITFETKETGKRINVNMDEESYESFVAEYEAERQREKYELENRWYKKVCRWTKNAATDVADWVTFWN